MTGTNADIAVIIPVAVVLLAAWLIAVYYANAHPRWRTQEPMDSTGARALGGAVPAQRLSGTGPVVPGQRGGAAADEHSPEQARTGETGRE